jgi:threonine dehydrogenase-like Zn-dependent dehydrogenase
MRGTVLYGAGDVRFEEVPEQNIAKPTHAILRLAATCVCGSDLVPTPLVPSKEMIPNLLATSDVLGTGLFAAAAANVKPGMTVAVVGDGAVGLTPAQASEVLTHLAFYAGWSNAFSALPVVKEVFEKRQK